MKWKSCFRVSLLSFCCLASVVSWTSAAITTSATPSAETTTVETFGFQQQLEYPSTCYVERSKVRDLITRMNQTVQILSREDEFLQCRDKMEAVIVDSGDIEMCSEERILRIQKNLSEVAAKLFKLAVRLSEPSEEEVFSLDTKKFRLIDDLRALQVFYGPSPCDSSSIVLYPFGPLVEYVERSLNQVLALFQTTRPTRPAPPTTTTTSTFPSTTPKRSVEDMLDPHATFVELTEMAKSNPSAMSRAIPRIVSQRYNEKASTFDKLLAFSEGLPTTENQIFGVSAIHDEMYRYNRNPGFDALVKVAKSVERLNKSASTTPEPVDDAAVSKLSDFIHDSDLGPLVVMLNPDLSFEKLTELARFNPTAMSKAISEIVHQRYNSNFSSLNALLNFIEGLPKTENKIFGFAAVHGEIRQNQSFEMHRNWPKLAQRLKNLNETDSTTDSVEPDARSKFADLVNDPELNPIILMLSPGKSFFELTEMARSNPTAMSRALPEIISQRWTVNVSSLDGILAFVEGLLTIENQIVGLTAIRAELLRFESHPEPLKLMKLSNSVHRVNESATLTLSVVDETAKSKFASLTNDPALNPLNLLLNPEWTYQELTAMARLNSAAMSAAVSRIVSQRYNEKASAFDKLLAFSEGLPTTENQIFGVSAIHDEMYRYNRNPESDALVKMAKAVERLNKSASATSEPVDAAAVSKLTNLVHDSDLVSLMLMLDPELSLLELTELAHTNPQTMSRAISEIVRQRFSSFNALLNFIEGLSKTENKIFGFAAVHREIRHNRSFQMHQHWTELARRVKHLNETDLTTNFVEPGARSKFADLVNDPELNPIILMLSPGKSFFELTEMARSSPTAMSRALPQIISKSWTVNVSSLEGLLDFVEGLPTTENQIVGLAAIRDEMFRFETNPEPLKLLKLRNSVHHVHKSASPTSSLVDETEKSKLADLVDDLAFHSLNLLLNPQRTYQELTEMARLNSSAMSAAVSTIVSQRYNKSVSSFEDLLNFIEGLPTAENKIFGFYAIHSQILHYSLSPTVSQMLKMAKTVERLSETVGTSFNDTSAAMYVLADLVHNLRPLILIGEKAECTVTNVAYQLRLHVDNWESPAPARLDSDSTYRFQVYPTMVKDGRLVFRINRNVWPRHGRLHASDANPNTGHVRYGQLPRTWKLSPTEKHLNQFYIQCGRSDDIMFAHRSATGYQSYPRVLLGRQSYSRPDHIPEADNWAFDCTPGNFTITTNRTPVLKDS